MIKKILYLVLVLIISASAFGCSHEKNIQSASENSAVSEVTTSQEQADTETEKTDAAGAGTTATESSGTSTGSQTQSTDNAAANTNTQGAVPKTNTDAANLKAADTKTQTNSTNPQTSTAANTKPGTANTNSQTTGTKPAATNTNSQTTTGSTQTPATEKQVSKDPIMALGKLEFSLKDIEGDEYDSSSLFKENKLTMINIWGTLCTPCIKELPELQELSAELSAKGIGIIGLVGDVNGEEGLEDALAIVKKKKVEFINLVPDDSIREKLLSKIKGYPVTIFIDSSGNFVGEVVVGARSRDEYREVAERVLSTIN